ncbi:hypothetical protein CGLO_11654 [Colletotrichum gloeosporioides Cg-14]|nr:hypothetical protein CGLO_11654 [Colletotrichum gloeosporioides Cg-14]
MLIKLS